MKTKEFIKTVNGEFDIETLELMQGLINKRLTLLKSMQDVANKKQMSGTTGKSKGLGDTVEKITKATGIKSLFDTVTGGDCGCKERKEKLNKKFPYE